MPETKEEIAAERDALREKLVELNDRLAAAGVGAPAAPTGAQHVFQLSEGERQELEQNGWIVKDGLAMTRADVVAKLGDDQRNVKIAECKNPRQIPATLTRPRLAGVDYIGDPPVDDAVGGE